MHHSLRHTENSTIKQTYKYSVAKFMHKFTKSFPQLLITSLPALRKFIHVVQEIRLSQTNISFFFFILYELNVQLNLEMKDLLLNNN